jgi:GT2 family glycosyltransferase
MRSGNSVSIIILSAGDGEVTFECLRYLKKSTKYSNFEIIVVHNGTGRGEIDILEKKVGKLKNFTVRFFRNNTNLGYAMGNNQAAQKAKGDLLCFVNNDVIVTSGWLTTLVSFLKSNPQAVACQPKLRSNIEKKYFDYSGGAGGFIDMFGYPFTRGRLFDYVEKDVGQYDSLREVAWASGSCLLIRSEAFRKAGGFDDYFFSYMEEIDLCIRLKRQGHQIYCVPSVKVYHYGAYTSNLDLRRKVYLNHRNNLYLVLKHYSVWPYLPLFFLRILFDLLSIIYYLWELRFGFVLAVIHAYGSLAIDFSKLSKRKIISLRGRSLMIDDTVYRGSVVVSHFLFRRNNFSQVMDSEVKKGRSYKRYLDVTFFNKRLK